MRLLSLDTVGKISHTEKELMTRRRKSQPADTKLYRADFWWMGVGIEFCLVISFFMFIGYWFDKLENTSPDWMILGYFIGFGLMLYLIVKHAKLTNHELHEDEINR